MSAVAENIVAELATYVTDRIDGVTDRGRIERVDCARTSSCFCGIDIIVLGTRHHIGIDAGFAEITIRSYEPSNATRLYRYRVLGKISMSDPDMLEQLDVILDHLNRGLQPC